MKLRTLLNIQRSVEERAIPSDVLEFDSTHYSKSKDVEINILDLHLTHAIRILNNYLEDTLYPMDVFDRGEINNNLVKSFFTSSKLNFSTLILLSRSRYTLVIDMNISLFFSCIF